jgi:hypothetical protein
VPVESEQPLRWRAGTGRGRAADGGWEKLQDFLPRRRSHARRMHMIAAGCILRNKFPISSPISMKVYEGPLKSLHSDANSSITTLGETS